MADYSVTGNTYFIIYNDESKNVFGFTAFGKNGQTLTTFKEVNAYSTLEDFNAEMVRPLHTVLKIKN